MHKKLIAVLIGLAVAVSFSHVAQAAKGGQSANKKAYEFHGTVESVTTDEDPATPDSINVLIQKTSGNGKRLGIVAGNSVYVGVNVNGQTRFYGAAASLADIAAGDRVKVNARYDGTGFAGKAVKEKRAA